MLRFSAPENGCLTDYWQLARLASPEAIKPSPGLFDMKSTIPLRCQKSSCHSEAAARRTAQLDRITPGIELNGISSTDQTVHSLSLMGNAIGRHPCPMGGG